MLTFACQYTPTPILFAGMSQVRAGMNWQNGHYELITDDAYQPHEQVFVSYGPHDNTTLFLNYGFTLPHNLHNSVCFSVGENFLVSNFWFFIKFMLQC